LGDGGVRIDERIILKFILREHSVGMITETMWFRCGQVVELLEYCN